MVRFLTTNCAVNDIVVAREHDINVHNLNALRSTSTALARHLSTFLSRPECDISKVDAVVEVIAQRLPSIETIVQLGSSGSSPFSSMQSIARISRALRLRFVTKATEDINEKEDFMDIDNGFDSQASGSNTRNDYVSGPREEIALSFDISSFRLCVTGYVQLITSLLEATSVQAAELAPSFVEYLLALSPADLCASRPLLEVLFTSSLPITPNSTEDLIDHLGGSFLEDYEYERHEIALATCLDLLVGYSYEWTDPDHKSLYDAASHVYKWFVTTVLANGLCSPFVEKRIAELFTKLVKVRGPEFKPFDSIPSIRTGLFSRLKDGSNTVKYCIAIEIHQFFDKFILGEHETVFNDVYSSLPDKVDSSEGLALRIFVLGQLGSKWPTLLRRSLYHIFETAGMIPITVGHASLRVQALFKTLSLPNARELFKLFAPQFLYSWLRLQSIQNLPFLIFGYQSLKELLADCQEEVFAQLTMRAMETEIAVLEGVVDLNRMALMRLSFARTAAYCLAWDIDSAKKDGSGSNSEKALKSHLGSEDYTDLLQAHFPQILSIIISSVEGENIQKYIYARDDLQQATVALKEMIATSASTTSKLPAELQPLFLGKTLVDKIHRLCRRVGRDYSRVWTPELYVYVLRILLNRINPAFGSLQACSTIRKIRLLVSLAGPAALVGYSLEMALHALQPLMVDKQCADDTIGVFQYLLRHGSPHLLQNISFTTNIVVTTLVSLRKFVGSTQESTTQESQHRATMDKAARFHSWLIKTWCTSFTKQYALVNEDPSKLKAFMLIVQAAAEARAEANATEGTPESQLLREILDDQKSGRLLIQGPARAQLFSVFCSKFEAPSSYREDILGLDALAASYAQEVWKSCQGSSTSDEYLLWAAKVLGRAYVSTGSTRNIVRIDADKTGFGAHESDRAREQGANFTASHYKRVARPCAKPSQSREACIAEDTIRVALTRDIDTEAMTELKDMLPSTIVGGLTLDTPDLISPMQSLSKQSLRDAIIPREEVALESWVRETAVALCIAANDDDSIFGLACCQL